MILFTGPILIILLLLESQKCALQLLFSKKRKVSLVKKFVIALTARNLINKNWFSPILLYMRIYTALVWYMDHELKNFLKFKTLIIFSDFIKIE